MSEVDRVATREAWVAVAGCQQAYDCSNEGTSDGEPPASVCVSECACVCVLQMKVVVEHVRTHNTHKTSLCFMSTNKA